MLLPVLTVMTAPNETVVDGSNDVTPDVTHDVMHDVTKEEDEIRPTEGGRDANSLHQVAEVDEFNEMAPQDVADEPVACVTEREDTTNRIPSAKDQRPESLTPEDVPQSNHRLHHTDERPESQPPKTTSRAEVSNLFKC